MVREPDWASEDGDVLLYLGDCLEVLPNLKLSVDAVVVDPPYGITSLEWDRVVDGWPKLTAALLKSSGSMWIFGSLKSLVDLASSLSEWKMAQDVVWEKHNGSNFHADRFKRVHEIVVQYYRGKWSEVYKQPQYTADATKRTVRRKQRPPHMGHIEAGYYESEDGGPRLMRSVIYARSCHGYAVHRTQKPVEIVRPLVDYSCPEDGVVLDPFMGSGTTGVACVNTGRRFVGIEKEPNYFWISVLRISEAIEEETDRKVKELREQIRKNKAAL